MKSMTWIVVPLCLALGACGDPLRDVERVSDGLTELPDDSGSAALPSDEELAREGSVLSGLFGPRAPSPDEHTAVASTDVAPDASIENQAADAPADAQLSADVPEGVETPEHPTGRGVLGWLRRAAAAEDTPETETETAETVTESPSEEEEVIEVAVAAPIEDTPDLVEPEKRARLFGGLRATPARRTGPDARDVPKGTVLPFGEIARVCDARTRELGTLVDRAARKGPGYYLYDSAPDSAGPRTFYITGFADNCPRQFTASLAIFGAPEFHEQLRYGLPAEEYPYSTTDKAYEKLKSRICHVGRNTPCGGRISRLEKTTVFVSVYENFGENARWSDMLLHDGTVLAAALKTP
ncbi:hypothetical protein [uncultured Tateyamaria sp.]|uniref:hypothetical protein n=1 Tax=uncultured Tateyamaria sp. TaxID=455651 RepID=UPI00261FB479|nr:hypothetical protein [uncultured Tateyamaria sp.]